MNLGKMIRNSAVLLSLSFALPLSAEMLGSWPEGGDRNPLKQKHKPLHHV